MSRDKRIEQYRWELPPGEEWRDHHYPRSNILDVISYAMTISQPIKKEPPMPATKPIYKYIRSVPGHGELRLISQSFSAPCEGQSQRSCGYVHDCKETARYVVNNYRDVGVFDQTRRFCHSCVFEISSAKIKKANCEASKLLIEIRQAYGIKARKGHKGQPIR